MGEFVTRRERHRLLQRQLRSLQFAASEINHTEVRQRIKIVRRFCQDLLINFFGGAVLAFVETLFGLPGEVDNIRRNVRLKNRGNRVLGRTLDRRVSRHRFFRSGRSRRS